jgi:AraC-like DNA-binding protein
MNPPYNLQIINCGEVTVAASCVSKSDEETPAYLPAAVLSYARKGQLHIRTENQLHTVPRGTFVLLRKYTEAAYFKTFTDEEGEAKGYNFILNNDFIRKVIKNVPMPAASAPISERVIMLDATPQLLGLMDSIALYVDHGEDLDHSLVELKTLEALMAIVQADENLAAIFMEYSKVERADISKFMQYNYLQNINLSELAFQSGRSLSTFNRDFRLAFNETPHKWILRKRLERAKVMLVQEQVKPSDVYLQVGFEDLAHFSKAFKKQYHVSPSRI